MIAKFNSKHKASIILTLILSGEVVFFLPFVLARIFRPTLLEVLDISNLELGTYFSIYGIVAMASYLFGGPMADRFASRNLIAYSLWFTAIGGLVLVFIPSGTVLKALYAFWGFTTIFMFWAALIKATREWGGDGFQGRAFGLLEGGRGLAAALLGSLVFLIFAMNVTPELNSSNFGNRKMSFQFVIMATSAITFLCGILVWIVLPRNNPTSQYSKLSIQRIVELIKLPGIWMQAIIIICGYVGYKITDDISLYANVVLGFDEVDSAGVGSASLWLRPVFALLAGLLADRIKGLKVISICFISMIIGGILIYFNVLNGLTWFVLLVLAGTLMGVYGIRAVYFAVMKESGVSVHATGTAVGIMSVVGYTPDIFMSPLMGYLLDSFPGPLGHQYVFLVLSLFSLLGLVVSILFSKYIAKLPISN